MDYAPDMNPDIGILIPINRLTALHAAREERVDGAGDRLENRVVVSHERAWPW